MGEMTLAQYGVGVSPTPTPSATPTPTATPDDTPTPTPTQVAPVRIFDTGYPQDQDMPVYMETETSDATIFYTRKPKTCPVDPTHQGPDPTEETLVYDLANPPTIVPGAGAIFSALGYRADLLDSVVTQCIYEDNVQEGPETGPERSVNYVWDKAGNRSSVSDSALPGTDVYLINALNQYRNVSGRPVTNGPAHEIKSYDAVSYEYMGDSYLAQANAAPNIYTLYYDALGRCVKRVRSKMGVDTVTYYLFEGEHWILEYNPDGTVQSNVLYGNGIDEMVARFNGGAPVGSQLQWPYPDRNNNTSVVTGEAGEVLESYRYDAFGQPSVFDGSDNPLPAGTAIANRFLFTGREWNATYKFYEYRARAYSPALGRFMTEDPKGFAAGDFNLYRYVSNDPLDKTDPMGLDFDGSLDAKEVERIEGNRFGITGVRVDVVPVTLQDGDYSLRLDVKVVRREVAQKVIWHGKERIRTEEQKRVTAEEHEKTEHNKDWKGFHDAHQSDVSNTRFGSKPEADAAAKKLDRREQNEALKATKQFEKQEHEDKKRWEPILIRERPN